MSGLQRSLVMLENKSGCHPSGHRVLVLPDSKEETTASGIVIHSLSQLDREQMAQMEGIIVDVGSTCWDDVGGAWAHIGDRILFAKYAGTVRIGLDGLEYRIINDLDVVAILDKEI